MLKRYCGHLVQNGVTDFTWEQCQADYLAGCYRGMMMAVVSSTVVGETERGNEMFAPMATGHGCQILDLSADSVLIA